MTAIYRSPAWPRFRTIACRALQYAVVLSMLTACGLMPRHSNDDEGAALESQVDSQALDLRRVMGTWYVIGHVPYFTERGNVAARDEYAPLPDGRIAVRYVYRTGFHSPVRSVDAIATVTPHTGNREWRLHFLRVVRATQRIVEVAPDDSWALVISPDRDLAWIFARTPSMDAKTYQGLLRKLRGYHINSDKVWRVAQTPSQVGGLGFERPDSE